MDTLSFLHRLSVCLVDLRLHDREKICAFISDALFPDYESDDLQVCYGHPSFSNTYQRDLFDIQNSNAFFWMMTWMFLLLLWFFPAFRWERFTPFILQGGHDQVKGGIEVYAAFLGYELSILLFPYVEKTKKSMAAIYVGNAMLSLSYLCLALICFGFFSLGQLKRLLYPVLDLLAYIQLPFIERLENLLYGFFLFLILMTVVMYWWAAEEAVKRIVPKLKTTVLVFVMMAVSYAISFIPKTLDQVNVWITNLGYAAVGIAFGFPILLLIVLLIQGKARSSHE